jgi:hypothetical protein
MSAPPLKTGPPLRHTPFMRRISGRDVLAQ